MELNTLSSVSNNATKVQPNPQPKVAKSPSSEGHSKKASASYSSSSVGTFERGILFNSTSESGDIGIGVRHSENIDVEDIDKKTERNTNDSLDRAIEQINEKLAGYESECSYNVHKQTGIVNIKILNSKTKEVIREIPPVNRLDALAKMWELAGILLDKKG